MIGHTVLFTGSDNIARDDKNKCSIACFYRLDAAGAAETLHDKDIGGIGYITDRCLLSWYPVNQAIVIAENACSIACFRRR